MDDAPHANRNPNGNLYVRYLYFNDGRWNWNYNWLDNDWNGNNPAALCAVLFISLPTSCWESFVYRECGLVEYVLLLVRSIPLTFFQSHLF